MCYLCIGHRQGACVCVSALPVLVLVRGGGSADADPLVVNARKGPYMRQSHRQRQLRRPLVVGAALIGWLAMAGPANAALGGATAATFLDRPNLRSVTFDNNIAGFHFDRDLRPAGNFGSAAFKLGGYDSAATSGPDGSAANISVTDPKTVLVTYASQDVDIDARTFGAVQNNAVQGLGISNGNLRDATAVVGAQGENGSRGKTVGPDLQSVALDSDNNRVAYTFDQEVNEVALNAANASQFGFVDSSGTPRFGADIIDIDGPVVIVHFANNALNDVDRARQAFVLGNAQIPRSEGNNRPGAPQSNVGVPGKAPLTSRPSLESAQLSPDSGAIVYTFDQPIVTTAGAPGGFTAISSNATPVAGTSATVLSGNRVRVLFSTSDFTEHLVQASVAPGTVRGVNAPGLQNAGNGKPIGGNLGAKATGFTTAPDVLSATINRDEGEVTVTFDSRLSDVDPTQFVLRDEYATVIPGPPATATFTKSTGPSTATVFLQYTPAQTAVGQVIDVDGNRNDGGAGSSNGDGFNTVVGNNAVTGTSPPPSQFNVRVLVTPSETTSTFSKR